MRLVINNESESLHNISLRGKTIIVGHEPPQCQLCFIQSQWPMVARLHAEFRVVSGVCYLFNLNSDSDTFVDSKKITQSAPIRIGTCIQFGLGGPLIMVLHLDLADNMPHSEAPTTVSPQEPQPENSPQETAKIIGTALASGNIPPKTSAYIEVEGYESVNVKRLEINKEIVRFGRSQELDLVFDEADSFISRIHAEIRYTTDGYILSDLDSFNGTLLNEQRINGPRLLRNGDAIKLGRRGPLLRFRQTGIRLPLPPPMHEELNHIASTGSYIKQGGAITLLQAELSKCEPIYGLSFSGKSDYIIGRSPECDVRLEGLQISRQHARLTVLGQQVFIEDNRSTNGVYVNGLLLTGRKALSPQDVIQIGPFALQADLRSGLEVFDIRAQVRIDSVGLTKVVPSGVGAKTIKVLDGISLTIQPNEFVGVLGRSGSGKSTFIDALSGVRPATAGHVLINNLDLHQNLNWLAQSIGYVSQDNSVHGALTVYRTLYFAAKLRLSKDMSESEIELMISEVLDLTNLSEQRNLLATQLSGDQRKRISIAIELLTKPSVFFADEPTSGLDTAAAEKIMVLFRQFAASGHTVVLTTQAMENVEMFDKVVILMHGKTVFYGTPPEALSYVKAKNVMELYEKLEEPIIYQIAALPSLPANASPEQQRNHLQYVAQIKENVAEDWKQGFQQTTQHEQYVRQPQINLPQLKHIPPAPMQRTTFIKALVEWKALCQRYSEILRRDKFNLLILFSQAPIIACLTWLAVAASSPRDFLYFILSLAPIWFGISIAAREVVCERTIYRRERRVNLSLWSYIGSKIGVLTFIVSLQCLLLFSTLKLFTILGLLKLPTLFGGLPHLVVMILSGMVSIALGLLVSAYVKSSERATSLMLLLLTLQILFSGVMGIPKGLSNAVGALMPATWSFDEMKRLSATEVKVLRGKDEGAESAYNNDGLGLYKQIKYENDQAIEAKVLEMRNYIKSMEEKINQLSKEIGTGQKNPANKVSARSKSKEVQSAPSPEIRLDPPPKSVEIRAVPDDLSDYVDFLYPLGSVSLNPIILLAMFLSLIAATVRVLRTQDTR